MNRSDTEHRILICAPRGRDAPLMADTLQKSGITSTVVASMEELCREIAYGVGGVILTEEALNNGALAQLKFALAMQEPWSDLPIIILTSGGLAGTERTLVTVEKLERGANMTLLERPLRSVTLVSAIHVALRNRMCQYEIRSMTADLERRVAQRTSELQRLIDEAVGFSYTISHDLRSPLRTIVSTSKILLEDYSGSLPTDAKEELVRQAEAANSLAQLIDDLLRLSRLAREEMHAGKIDISRMASDIVSKIPAGLGALCTYTIQPKMDGYGDPTLVRIALVNLIQNACKFSPDGGGISVGQASDGSYFVKDEGIGFEQKYEHKMFLPFERLVTAQQFPGTGIGLANVKRIIERHGGRTWAVSSGTNKGSSVHFTLPNQETHR